MARRAMALRQLGVCPAPWQVALAADLPALGRRPTFGRYAVALR